MKTTCIRLNVVHPSEVQPDEVAAAINTLLNVGLSDAQDTISDEERDNVEARLAASLQIGQPIAEAAIGRLPPATTRLQEAVRLIDWKLFDQQVKWLSQQTQPRSAKKPNQLGEGLLNLLAELEHAAEQYGLKPTSSS